MDTAEKSKLKLAYEGSVKRVFHSPVNHNLLWFEFTDDYSIFDWGKMPDVIANKGRSLSIIGSFFFEKLCQANFWQQLKTSAQLKDLNPDWLKNLFDTDTFKQLSSSGCLSHFRALVTAEGKPSTLTEAGHIKGPVYMEVEKAEVKRPTAAVLLDQNVFFYPPLTPVKNPEQARLIPLEVVFRFGMPGGSSLKARLEKNPEYAQLLGLTKKPVEGQYFDRPVLEFYTKLEPKDRLLSVQEALLISGLTAEQFQELSQLSLSLALALFVIFGERGFELWDGKFEFITRQGKILLADSIGPDELRLLYKGCQLSKEMLRQIYRGGAWEKSLKTAQKQAIERCSLDWKNICLQELKSAPEPLSASLKNVIDKLYGVITNHLTGQVIFADHPSLDEFWTMAKAQNLVEG